MLVTIAVFYLRKYTGQNEDKQESNEHKQELHNNVLA